MPRVQRVVLASLVALVVLAPASAASPVVGPRPPAPLWVDVEPGSATAWIAPGTSAQPPQPDHFEYGTTAAYGQTAPIESGDGWLRVRLTGLTPDTTYHWRLAQALATTDQTFRTSPAGAPVPSRAPSVAYTGDGPTLLCDSGAWDDASSTIAFAWQLAGASTILAGPTQEYTNAGTTRCTVSAVNSAGRSTASALFAADESRIALRVLDPAQVHAYGEPDGPPESATCDGRVYGRSGPEQRSYRWWRDGAELATDTAPLPLSSSDIGATIVCEITHTRGGETVVNRSQPFRVPPVPTPRTCISAWAVVTCPSGHAEPSTTRTPPASPAPEGEPSGRAPAPHLDPPRTTTVPSRTLRLAVKEARTIARNALARRYGHRKTTTVACRRLSGASVRCRATVRAPHIRRGTVTVTARPSGTPVVKIAIRGSH